MGRLLVMTAYLTLSTSLLFSQPPLPIIGYLKGDNQNDRLGTSLAGPGDVNGDGYADLLASELGTKRVKLFYGNAGRIDSIPDMIWNGYSSWEGRETISAIGDINGDGKPEVVMRKDSLHQLRIFWGGNLLDTIPDFVMDFRDSICYGASLQDVAASDVNGDGYGDLVVSMEYNCGSSGRVQIFWGGPLLDTVPDWTRTVPNQLSPEQFGFGKAVQVVYINGDSFGDLVVSQMGNIVTGTTGRLFIFLGGNPMDTLEDQIINAPPPQGDAVSQWGYEIVPMNDMNGDGKTDFWVGGYGTLLRLYYGAFPVDTVPAAILDEYSSVPVIATGGDFNRDGFTDLIFGQPIAVFLAGNVFVYLGSRQMDGKYDIAIHDYDMPYVAEVLGLAVTNTGDMNGDGVDDFAASAKFDTDPWDRGEVFIFSGDSSIPTGVKDDKTNLPRSFELYQNYPNPFNSNTVISYSLSRRSSVRLEVFNVAGQMVKLLANQEHTAGTHKIFWDGTDSFGKPVSSGIYLYRIKVDEVVETKKMTLIR